MPRWYGIRGHWINDDLPQDISIDRNPENCCAIKNDADEVSGIIMQLKLVKTSSEGDIHSTEERCILLHDTKIMFNIFQPWVNKQRRVESADTYFASV